MYKKDFKRAIIITTPMQIAIMRLIANSPMIQDIAPFNFEIILFRNRFNDWIQFVLHSGDMLGFKTFLVKGNFNFAAILVYCKSNIFINVVHDAPLTIYT